MGKRKTCRVASVSYDDESHYFPTCWCVLQRSSLHSLPQQLYPGEDRALTTHLRARSCGRGISFRGFWRNRAMPALDSESPHLFIGPGPESNVHNLTTIVPSVSKFRCWLSSHSEAQQKDDIVLHILSILSYRSNTRIAS